MNVVSGNERSWAIELISEINIFLRSKSIMIKKAGGESTVSVEKRRMFPDLLLYSDENMSNIIQGWELKMPDTPITDIEFNDDAERKARALGLDSYVIWNFNDCRFFIKQGDKYEMVKNWAAELNHINSRQKVLLHKEDWKNTLHEVILFINEYFELGHVIGNKLNVAISDNIISTIIKNNKGITAEKIMSYAKKNARIESYLNLWWKENKIEYLSDEEDVYSAYSKTLILNWINKILFSNLIKQHHSYAREVEKIKGDMPIEDATNIFKSITKKCDFYNILSPIPLGTSLAPQTWDVIKQLNEFLISNKVDELEQETLQKVLEESVLTSKREINGQYTTPQILADILVKTTVIDRSTDVLDPCCGTGTIVKSVMEEKEKHLKKEEVFQTTWASDKYSFPLQIANISVTNYDAIDIPSLIFQSNVFDLVKDKIINITNPKTGEDLNVELPQFGSIVSNLPFIPFEIISNDEVLKIEEVKIDVKNNTGVTLDGRGDLYSYILFSLWSNLVENGRLGVIISNSWLGAGWGKQFRDALLQYFNIEDVIISGNGKWFKNADVVTTILILSKKSISKPNLNNNITFNLLKIPLDNVEKSTDMKDVIINSILLDKDLDNSILERKKYTLDEIQDLENMGISWNALFYNAKWLIDISDKLKPISKHFIVTRGERRGWDKLFYPQEGHGIEKEYLRRVLKSGRSIKNLITKTDSDAFCCSESLESLIEKGHHGAYNWIKKFEGGFNTTGKRLTEVLKRKDMHWYEMRDTSVADLVTPMNPDKRLFISKLDQRSFINQRIIGLTLISDVDIDLCHALLNSIIGMYYIEASGFGRGLGVLDINKKNINEIYMLDPALISDTQKTEILNAFKPLLDREILDTSEELKLNDRIEFDRVVLRAYQIEDYYDIIKESLLQMQKSRLSVRNSN